LHENEIEPATEFVADLPEVGDTLESQALVKPDRGIVRCVYAADHDVLALAESQRKQRLDKGASDASSTNVLSDMHPMRDRVAVSRPRTSPIPESGEAENITWIGGSHDTKPCAQPILRSATKPAF
jgi:hypothetical protein